MSTFQALILLLAVLHQLDQKIIYSHYDFKHLTEKYFEIGMKLDDFLIQLVKYWLGTETSCIRTEETSFRLLREMRFQKMTITNLCILLKKVKKG